MSRPRVRYQLAVSLDGLIGTQDGSADWLDPYGSVAMAALGPYLKEIGGLVMGRVTYEQMRGFGPGPFDDIPTVVLTTNSTLQVGASAQVCLDGPQGAIDAIEKRIDGDIWLFGGGKTAACFLDEGLIDLIELTVVPVVLGTGLPLFPGVRDPVTFELVSSRVGELGTVSMVYAKRSDR